MAVSAVVASSGDGGVRAGRTEEGESEREPDGSGGRVASSRRVEAEPGRQGGRMWPRRVAARVGHAPSPTGARRKATGERLVGWAAAGLHSVGLRVGCQVSSGKFLLYFTFLLFSIFLLFVLI